MGLGYTAAPLDARFTTVRTKESNMGNFVCDLMRYYYDADCCIMAAGTIRGDQIYPPGILRLKDVVNCFPFEDPVVVLKVTGKAIWDALENGVSSYPSLEGRFPQVSNIFFEIDYSRSPNSRLLSAQIDGSPIDFERKYVLATRGYMGRGKDGYTSLLIEHEGGTAEEIVSEENGVLISTILRQYFMSLKVLGRWKYWGPSIARKFDRVQHSLQRTHSFMPASPSIERKQPLFPQVQHPSVERVKLGERSTSADSASSEDSEVDPYLDEQENEDDGAEYDDSKPIRFTEREMSVIRRVMKKWWRLAGLEGQPKVCDTLQEDEFQVNWTTAIAPRVEGRIVEINKDEASAA